MHYIFYTQSHVYCAQVHSSNRYHFGKPSCDIGEDATRRHPIGSAATAVQCLRKYNNTSAGLFFVFTFDTRHTKARERIKKINL